MVTQYGMTQRLGAVRLGENDAQPFLGRDLMHARNYSEAVAAIVDEEISKLITEAHQEAFDILTENRDVLDALVVALLERETLDKAEVAAIFEPLRRRNVRPAWTGSNSRIPSTIPPVASIEAARGYGGGWGTGSEGDPEVGPEVWHRHWARHRPGRRGFERFMSIDQPRAEAAIRELLFAIGEDPDRDGLRETPRRVANSVRRTARRDGPGPVRGAVGGV